MADLATAYVQILPSVRGLRANLTSALSGEVPSAGRSAGNMMGTNIVGAIKKVVAAAGIGEFLRKTLPEGSELEQLTGGMEKIFDGMDTSQIMADAANAYKDLNMSANDYLATINDVGATFSATMGAEKGYNVAKTGLQAISDYASGTGKSVDVLSEKFTMITRSTSSYQSIADQFSGILPATSADFLKQAQAAGFLSSKYKTLTKVPVAEYQEAVSKMLQKGVDALNLTGNTAAETEGTFSGSLAAMKASLSNILGNLALGNDIQPSLNALASTTKNFLTKNLTPMVKNIFTALPGAVSVLLSDLIPGNVHEVVDSAIANFTNFVTENLPTVLDSGIQTLTSFIQGITQHIPSLSESASQIISAVGDYLTNTANLEGLLSAGGDLLATVATGIINVIGTLSTTAIEVLGKLADYLSDPENLSKLLEKAGEIGGKIATAIWENLVAVFDNLKKNFPNLMAGIEIGMDFSNTGSVPIPKASTGMNYVPYDNYLVRLHEGEMVLRKSQANMLRSGDNSSGGVVINQYIYSQAQTAADLMREARYEAEKAVLLDV